MKTILSPLLLTLCLTLTARAQDYVSPTKPAQTGRSPGVKVKLLSSTAKTKTYVLIFAKNDEVVSGVTEFARKYNVKSAHYTGIGDALSAKVGWFDYDRKLSYSPTLILQKEVFYEGYTAALVNPVKYNNLVGTLTTSYNNYGLFNAGLQFMVKTPNVEFYIGSDRVIQSASLFRAANKSTGQINNVTSFSGADFFMGFSLKFGHVIEHPLNSTVIPIGDRPGLIKRMWNGIWGIDNGD
ncbi:MAG: DUF296 domain-containing protein [Hymenobacter sp.]|nr:MAG: DUF296 domain-containing protein [Hymenobacter sp.]